jgi:hypothetical protein
VQQCAEQSSRSAREAEPEKNAAIDMGAKQPEAERRCRDVGDRDGGNRQLGPQSPSKWWRGHAVDAETRNRRNCSCDKGGKRDSAFEEQAVLDVLSAAGADPPVFSGELSTMILLW